MKKKKNNFIPVIIILLAIIGLLVWAIVGVGNKGGKNDPDITDNRTKAPASTKGPLYTVTYAAEEHGIISGTPEQQVAAGETTETVTAVADAGYVFTGWSDGYTNPTRQDAVNNNAEYTAHFTRLYTVAFMVKPSGAGKISGETAQFIIDGSSTEAVSAEAASGYKFAGWSDGSTSAQYASFTPSDDVTLTACFEEIPEIAKIYITTDDGKSITSKEEYKTARFSVESAVKSYNIQNAACTIRGRGNSSWMMFASSKPSYRFKIDEKTQLLGLGAVPGRDYVLISNHGDATMLRNWIMLRLGQLMDNIPYTVTDKYVELYINNDYRGLYLLCEHIETGKSRIDIDDSGEDPDTGYLIELDSRSEAEPGAVRFTVKGSDRYFVIKSDGKNDAQVAYIKDYMSSMYAAMKSGDRAEIDRYADIPSVIDMFILQEFSKNRDVGFASFYMTKEKGGKIFFTCPWDFDLALGNDASASGATNLLTLTGNYNTTTPNLFFVELIKYDWFKKEVRARLNELKPVFTQLQEETHFMAEFLREANGRNDKKWDRFGHRIFWEPSHLANDLKSYDDHLNHLYNWMSDRISYIYDYFS